MTRSPHVFREDPFAQVDEKGDREAILRLPSSQTPGLKGISVYFAGTVITLLTSFPFAPETKDNCLTRKKARFSKSYGIRSLDLHFHRCVPGLEASFGARKRLPRRPHALQRTYNFRPERTSQKTLLETQAFLHSFATDFHLHFGPIFPDL